MLREELYIFNSPNEKLVPYQSGASTIVFNNETKEWTISNPSGASAFLQYTTEYPLNIGDTVEVEFTGIDNGTPITTKSELVGGTWQDGYSADNRKDTYSNQKRMVLPIKKSGKHVISIGLVASVIGSIKVKDIRIKINTDAPKPPTVEKLHAKIFNNTTVAPGAWERYSYQATGDKCTITKSGNFVLVVTFEKSLVNKGSAFITVENSNNGVNYRVLPQDVTTNSVFLYIFNNEGAPVNINTIADKIYINVLLM